MDEATPTLPPLPPPTGSGISASSIGAAVPAPPPPTAPLTRPVVTPPSAANAPDRYAPAGWLANERGLSKDRKLTAKGVILGIVTIVVLFVLTAIILAARFGDGPDGNFTPVESIQASA